MAYSSKAERLPVKEKVLGSTPSMPAMMDDINAQNFNDDHGNPAGGFVVGVGLNINWQNGPLGRGINRQPPNGAFVETVINSVIQRLEYYQSSRFNCDENAQALDSLYDALFILNERTRLREEREVEGTHGV